MKKYIIIILFILACSLSEGEKNIPEFDGNIAYQYIIEQCDFGPRNPGSIGHQQFANLDPIRDDRDLPQDWFFRNRSKHFNITV